MRVLGVDPGLRVTGYGVIDVDAGSGALALVEAGVVRTWSSDAIEERLLCIHEGLDAVIREHSPQVLVIEKLFSHYESPVTSILMGHARGVVCLLSGIHRIRLASVPSTHVKKAVTGHGHAGKHQVQSMVQRRLGLKSRPEPPDVADALAVAMTYVFNLKTSERGG